MGDTGQETAQAAAAAVLLLVLMIILVRLERRGNVQKAGFLGCWLVMLLSVVKREKQGKGQHTVQYSTAHGT